MLAALALATAATLVVKAPARGADAYDSPATLNRPGADISDTYIFPSPSTPGNVVVVMNVHPGIAAGQGASTFFDQNVLYQMKFDNKVSSENGAAPVEDLVIQFSVGVASGGTQQVFVYGPAAPSKTGSNSSLLPQTGTGFVNQTFQTTNGMTVFMGARSDPFFFDLNQFYAMFPDRNDGNAAGKTSCLPASFSGDNTCPNGFNSPGVNSQASTNVLSIVVEMPKGLIEPSGTGPKIAYWATTSTASGN